MIRRIAFVAALAALSMPVGALATQQGVQVMKRWVAVDKCTQRAQQAFPDNTVEALAKRDAQLKQCLASQNLPPRDPLPLPSAKP
jgi:hypothetical protein